MNMVTYHISTGLLLDSLFEKRVKMFTCARHCVLYASPCFVPNCLFVFFQPMASRAAESMRQLAGFFALCVADMIREDSTLSQELCVFLGLCSIM